MAPVPESGEPILRELLQHIAAGRVMPNHPDTYPGYKEIHDALNLPRRAETFGDSLKVQGLADLAEWTLEEGHPAITGLIVDRESLMPGHGYFELFGRPQDDFRWWDDQIAASLDYDWDQFLASYELPPPTPDAIDLVEPPERIATTTYRILRDTELARHVKLLHNYECQICGHTIELSDGSRYAEAHHIRPLGRPHNGPDVIGNTLCVCPNHHAELDYGAAPIDLASLRQSGVHPIDSEYVDYHNRNIHANSR